MTPFAPFASEISGARVLDLASHDGRWSYAFAGVGAASVVGIEGRQEMIICSTTFRMMCSKAR
jgi:predicted RNA methylase